jgi:hypothetical protein
VFFGGKVSILSGKTEGVEWHHIDDKSHNSKLFPNFVPIEGFYNGTDSGCLGYLKKTKKSSSAHPDLCPQKLLATAEDWYYNKWKAERAYGCARLAYYVGKLYFGESPGQLLDYAARAFQYAQFRISLKAGFPRAQDLLSRYYPSAIGYYVLEDILTRDICATLETAASSSCPIVHTSIYSVSRALASFLAHHGILDRAVALHNLVQMHHLDKHLSSHSDYEALSLQRRFYTSKTGRAVNDNDRPAAISASDALRCIRKEAQSLRKPNLSLGLDLTCSQLSLLDAKVGEAVDILRPPVEDLDWGGKIMDASGSIRPRPGVTEWNIIEILLRNVFSVRRDTIMRTNSHARRQLQDSVAVATKLMSASGYLLTQEIPISIEQSLGNFGGDESLLCRIMNTLNHPRPPVSLVKACDHAIELIKVIIDRQLLLFS